MLQQDSLTYLAGRLGWLATPTRKGVRLSRPGQQEGQTWSVYFSASSRWVCFQWPIGKLGSKDWHLPDPLRRASLYRYLLTLNDRMFMPKFALDDEGQLLLAAEVPAGESQNTLTTRALESLTVYADRYLDAVASFVRPQSQSPQTEELPVARRLPEEAPGLPNKTLALYLKSIEPEGWGAREKPAGQTWHLGYKGRLRLFEVYLTPTASWTYFQLPVLVEPRPSALQAEGKIQAAFLNYLLRLNDVLYMAKFGLDDEGQVLLLLELPTEALDFPLFHLATRTLARYLDGYAQEVQIMASLDRDRYLTDMITRLETGMSAQNRR